MTMVSLVLFKKLSKMKYTKEEFEEYCIRDFNKLSGIHPCDCGNGPSNRVRYFNRSNYIVIRLIDCGCNHSECLIEGGLTFSIKNK